jgi:uncharacterized membrane protein (DUF373 family)
VLLKYLNKAVYVIEVVAAIALVIMTGLAVLTLSVELFQLVSGHFVLLPTDFTKLISTILEIFILIELFRIAVAYMNHENVLPTVFEAALVAVARKFVVFEAGNQVVFTAIGLSILLVSVAFSWWLLARVNVCEFGPQEPL